MPVSPMPDISAQLVIVVITQATIARLIPTATSNTTANPANSKTRN
ncbi:MAG: hypothetical protein F6K52_16675, partial [Moorea sp. SIO3H5]|nr:hypothetical protein [Moorena sp. SIO3H5]